jgi:uncharacterized protein (DUF488 family)
MNVSTVGYEGWYIDDFVAFLRRSQVQLVADIRKNPISRKKGFSKKTLREALAAVGIEYAHFGGLGVPSAWRKMAKDNPAARLKMFSRYVEEILPKKSDDLKELLRLAKENRVAILCFEADAGDCHRHFVVAHLRRKVRRLKVRHLAQSGITQV